MARLQETWYTEGRWGGGVRVGGGGGGGRGYSGFQKYRRLREKVTSGGGGLAGRGTREAWNVIPRAPRANYVKIWCGSGRLRCSRGLLCAAGSVERTRARNRGKFWHRLVGPPILHVEFNVRARAGLELLRRACRGTRAWFNRPLSKGRAYVTLRTRSDPARKPRCARIRC